jgi:ABC-type sugar transport system permease subunit/outer membrane protein assembly factor BamB
MYGLSQGKSRNSPSGFSKTRLAGWIKAGLFIIFLLSLFLAPHQVVSAQSSAAPSWEFSAGSIVHSLAISADGHAIVVGSRDGFVFYLDRNGKQIWKFDSGGTVFSLAISHDGQRVLVGTESRSVFLLDGNGKQLWKKNYDFVINAVAISGQGDLIAVVPNSKTVSVLDGQGNELWQASFDSLPTAAAISSDGQRVAIGRRDAYVSVYDRKGQMLWQFEQNGVIRGLALSQDGSFLAVGDEYNDGYLVKEENQTGTNLWTFTAGDKVVGAALSGDGKVVALGSYDQNGYLLDTTGAVKVKYKTDGRVTSVALSADGSVFAIGSEDMKAYVFNVKQSQAGYAASQARTKYLSILLPSLFLIAIAAIVAYLHFTPRGRHFWERYGASTRHLLRQIWRARISYILLAPTVILLLVFNYYPAFSGLFHSFTKWQPGIKTTFIGLDNFVSIRFDEFFWGGLLNAVILVLTGFAKMVMPLLVAELLFHLRSKITQYWLRSLFIFPIVVPGVAIILIWVNILDPNIGLLNNFLSLLGLMNMQVPEAWLGDSRTAIWSIVAIGFPFVSPFALLLFYGGLISIPVELLDAAKVDGASNWGRFWWLDLPLLMGQIKLLLILGFIGGMQEFSLIFLTTEGGPYNATYTPALELYYQAMRFNNFGLASAMGTVLFLLILGGTILNLRMRTSVEY